MNKRQEDLERLERLAAPDMRGGTIDSGGPPPPEDIEVFTAEWCTEALTAGGVLAGQRVVDVRAGSLGPDTPGFLGKLCRLTLTYDQPGAGPSTVVAKTNSPEEFNRTIASTMGLYERECRVYQELAPAIPLRMPEHYYSTVDGDRFVLLMEDLGGARVGHQSQPSSISDMEAILDQAALLHARFMGAPELDELPWIKPIGTNAAIFDAALETRWPGFVEHFSTKVRPGTIEAGNKIIGRVHEVLALLDTGPVTLVHGDFRIDNVIMDVPPEPDRPLFIDWQSVGRAQGVFDVASVISLSLDPDTRSATERDLLERYARALEAITGAPVSRDDLYEGYRMGLVYPFAMGVAQTDMSTSQAGSDTGVWVARASQAVIDNGLPNCLS